MTVAVTRKEPGAVELRREAGRCRDARPGHTPTVPLGRLALVSGAK